MLWMWLTGVLGIARKNAEALLSVKYWIRNSEGQMPGGSMYVIERGMKNKTLAVLFAVFKAIAAFGIGNMVQANSISHMVRTTFNISHWISGSVMTVLTAIVMLGGIKSIAKGCEKLVPFMAVFYIVGCLIMLGMKIDTLKDTIVLIFQSAFTGQAAVGGFIGAQTKMR